MVRKSMMAAATVAMLMMGGSALAGYEEADQLYQKGEFNQALREFVAAGGGGNIEATYRAALMFEAGEGTDKNDETAAKWFQTAARAGHIDAMKKLAQMFIDGRGLPADPVQAWAILQIAIDRGDTEAGKQQQELEGTMRPGQIEAGKRRLEKIIGTYAGS
ncbi:MAG: tetratricopeptide repeat protein [Pseudomonadota bacterium]|nr:tetratricopeptide repeat protein [Pseudomonadota bacterium]